MATSNTVKDVSPHEFVASHLKRSGKPYPAPMDTIINQFSELSMSARKKHVKLFPIFIKKKLVYRGYLRKDRRFAGKIPAKAEKHTDILLGNYKFKQPMYDKVLEEEAEAEAEAQPPDLVVEVVIPLVA